MAEFGWELMSWQAWVRRLAPAYDHTVVCTTRGLEYLYADFCTDFRSHQVDGLRTCWRLDQPTPESLAVERKVAAVGDALRAVGWGVDHIMPTGFVATSDQRFIRYGHDAAGAPNALCFDVILHARNKPSNNRTLGCLNWPQREWDRLAQTLIAGGLRVACVGLRSSALLPQATVDLRDLPLRQTALALSSSQLVVGPSSGPMHLASLCGTRHLVWTIRMEARDWKVWGSSRERYERVWNPFGIFCTVVETTPEAIPTADDIAPLVFQTLTAEAAHG